MNALSAAVPMDGSTIYPTGVYACRDNRWFGTASVSSWPADSVVLTVALGDPIPRDFLVTPDNSSFAAMLTVPDEEIEAMCAVEATCVWKNVTWVIDSLDVPNNTAMLKLPLTSLETKQSAAAAPDVAELRSWPGVVVDASGVASARLRPAEMAAVTLQVTPYEIQPSLRRRDDLKSTGISVSSIPVSPWMSAADALHTAREAVSTSRADGYPVDRIRADRMRDGWRVWAPPPASGDPLGFRLGWAVWYVADDGVMWRSSTSTEFRAASQRMSNQLHQRLQQSRLGIL